MKKSALLAAFCLSAAMLHAASIPFPTGLIPFNSIANETAKDANGNVLVLGFTSTALLPALQGIPLPSSQNETFSSASVQLAPGQFFSNVFVPTPSQRFGDFSAFPEPLIDPLTGNAFARNIIPTELLFGNNGFFAFEVGPQATATPEPSTAYLLGGAFLLIALLRSRSRAGLPCQE
jgi:hypothetical protein